MICKLVGSLILLFAGGYVSVAITRFERRRLRVLDGYISLIYYIKGQIDCYAMPLPAIMASADPAVLAACLGLDMTTPPAHRSLYGRAPSVRHGAGKPLVSGARGRAPAHHPHGGAGGYLPRRAGSPL